MLIFTIILIYLILKKKFIDTLAAPIEKIFNSVNHTNLTISDIRIMLESELDSKLVNQIKNNLQDEKIENNYDKFNAAFDYDNWQKNKVLFNPDNVIEKINQMRKMSDKENNRWGNIDINKIKVGF